MSETIRLTADKMENSVIAHANIWERLAAVCRKRQLCYSGLADDGAPTACGAFFSSFAASSFASDAILPPPASYLQCLP